MPPAGEILPGPELIQLLNEYFELMAGPVEDHGGEILKFIGDAMLAIFPVEEDAATACRKALCAVHAARSALERDNAERAADGRQEIRYGLALHLGDVMYGNIGGAARLDFTVIGPAVNLTSRLESMCKNLDRSPLLSEEFVRASGVEAEFLGEFSLKGVTEKQTIFGLREGPASAYRVGSGSGAR